MANVLITGTSSGFGRLAAQHFASKGDTVFASMRNPEKAGDLAQENPSLKVVQLDVLDDASVDRAVKSVLDEAGSLDVLVNNAGVELRSSIEDASDEDVKWQFETNVFGLLRVTRAVLPAMRKQGSGAIVNVSSLAGIVSRPYGGVYSATKHALQALSEALYYELKPFGIRVALVQPGIFATALQDNARDAGGWNAQSPYWEHGQRFDERLYALPATQEQDPMDVAKVIYDVAHSESPKLHTLVGQDAEMIGAVRKQTPDFETYEQAIRTALDWWK